MGSRDASASYIKAFGHAVREQREALGLSQEELSFRSHLDRTYISGVERGVRNPTLRTMVRLAESLQTRVDKLIATAQTTFDASRR